MTSNRAAPTSQCVARGKKFEEDIYLYLIAFEKQLASLPYNSKCIQWGMCWRLVLFLFLQKKLFAEFLNRERKAFTSKCLEYTLSFHFFKKIVTYITLAKKGGDILSKSGGNESCPFRAHCDGLIVWYVWYVYFWSLSQPLITLLMLFSHWMTSRDNRGMSEIDANGLNILRDINCWLRYEIKNESVGYSSRNAGCT